MSAIASVACTPEDRRTIRLIAASEDLSGVQVLHRALQLLLASEPRFQALVGRAARPVAAAVQRAPERALPAPAAPAPAAPAAPAPAAPAAPAPDSVEQALMDIGLDPDAGLGDGDAA